jgi:hypothetical protein
MSPKHLFIVDQQVDEIMGNIMGDESLCVIREALTLYFSTHQLDDHRAAEMERPMFSEDL